MLKGNLLVDLCDAFIVLAITSYIPCSFEY